MGWSFQSWKRECLSAHVVTRNTSILAFIFPGALLVASACRLVFANEGLLFDESLWFPEFISLMGVLYIGTGSLGILASSSLNQWNSGTFCGACVALAALETGLFTIFMCERNELSRISRTLEPTLALRNCLEWIDAHPWAAASVFVALVVVQFAALSAGIVMGFLTWIDHMELESASTEDEGLEKPLLIEVVTCEGNHDAVPLKSKRWHCQRSFWEMGLALLLAQISLAGLVLLAATVALTLTGPSGTAPDEPGAPPPLSPSPAPGPDSMLEYVVSHHHHHHHHSHGSGSPPHPAVGNSTAYGLQWYPGMLAVVGTPLFWTGGIAAGGILMGGISTVRSFAGAGAVALLYELFGLHIYMRHRDLLDRATDFDASNGLRATLSWTDNHPVGTVATCFAFLLVQLLAILASAVYTTKAAGSVDEGDPSSQPEALPCLEAIEGNSSFVYVDGGWAPTADCVPHFQSVANSAILTDGHHNVGGPSGANNVVIGGSVSATCPSNRLLLGSGEIEPAFDADLPTTIEASAHLLQLNNSVSELSMGIPVLDSRERAVEPDSPRSLYSSCSSSSLSSLDSSHDEALAPSPWREHPRVGIPCRVVWGRVGIDRGSFESEEP
eukprot:jgi/Botrbrau1/9460/Bobra.0252s0081.1